MFTLSRYPEKTVNSQTIGFSTTEPKKWSGIAFCVG